MNFPVNNYVFPSVGWNPYQQNNRYPQPIQQNTHYPQPNQNHYAHQIQQQQQWYYPQHQQFYNSGPIHAWNGNVNTLVEQLNHTNVKPMPNNLSVHHLKPSKREETTPLNNSNQSFLDVESLDDSEIATSDLGISINTSRESEHSSSKVIHSKNFELVKGSSDIKNKDLKRGKHRKVFRIKKAELENFLSIGKELQRMKSKFESSHNKYFEMKQESKSSINKGKGDEIKKENEFESSSYMDKKAEVAPEVSIDLTIESDDHDSDDLYEELLFYSGPESHPE